MRKFMIAAVAFSAVTAAASPLFAADYQVHMLNQGTDGAMVFEPGLTQVKPGDTVTFVPTDKGHNAESVKGMIPTGATAFKGNMGEQIQVKFDVPGAYVVRCLPHFPMGMAALIVVGDPSANLDAIKTAKMPNFARKRIDADIAKIAQ